MSNFDLAEAVVEFTAGTEANWNNFALPIPNNVVAFSIDAKKFKKGDGNHRYNELPDGPSIAGIALGEQTLVNVLTQLVPADEDSLIVIDDEIYKASTTKLTDVVDRLTAIANKDTIQDANIAAITNQFQSVSSSIIAGDVGKLVVVGNHQLKPGIIASGMSSPAPVSPINIKTVKFYSDSNCLKEITALSHDTVAYCKVSACHDTADVDNITISLIENSSYVTPTNLGRGLFKLTIGRPATVDNVVFIATATYGSDTISISKTLSIDAYKTALIGIYGSSGSDSFRSLATDTANNIYAVGKVSGEGLGGAEALIIKFDSNLNILAKKRLGGTGDDRFIHLAINTNNDVYVVGWTGSEGLGGLEALIVKFDSNLNLLTKKIYGGASDDVFFSVAIDSAGNIYVVGYTSSEGLGGYDGFIIKFDSSLTILARKRYGGTGSEQFFGAAIDSAGNIYAVGYTTSEGLGGNEALIVKFDSNLNILARKRYGGTGGEQFYDVAISPLGFICTVGATASEGVDGVESLIVKFDSNLNIIGRKRYGGFGADYFQGVAFDTAGNIIASGYGSAAGSGNADAIVVKLDSNLNILSSKLFGGTGNDIFNHTVIDTNNNIYGAGYSSSYGTGSYGLVMKLPSLPSGSYTSVIYTNQKLVDSALTPADSTLTLADSTLTLADSTLTLADSTLTFADSTSNLITDSIIL